MNIKQRTITALQDTKFRSKLWATFALWKRQKLVPEVESFKVIIVGPPKTFKSRIGQWLQELWPLAQVTERWVPGGGHYLPPFMLADVADYSLVVRTFRTVRVATNGNLVCWEYATIPKCRWAPVDWEEHYTIMPRLQRVAVVP